MGALQAMAWRATVAVWTGAALLATNVHATYWTVTSYLIVSEVTSSYDTDYSLTYTSTLAVLSGATPTLSATSSSQTVRSVYELTVVYLYLPPRAVPDSEIQTTTTYDTDDVYTMWMEPTVYTAPSSCPTPFTYETTTWIDIPSEVEHLYTPSSVTSSVDTRGVTWVTAFLSTDEIALPTDDSDYIFSAYINSCSNPTAVFGISATKTGSSDPASTTARNGDDDDDDDAFDDLTVCSLATGCTGYRTWVIVVATLIPSLFALGFVESYLWFRRLMLGQGTLRFGTVCWVLISLWVLCFTRTQPGRGPQARAMMRQRWAITPGGRRFSLWWKWGFRHAYPVEMLGDPRLDVVGGGPGAPKVEGAQEAGQWAYPQGPPPPPPPIVYHAPVQQGYQSEQGVQPNQGYQPDPVHNPEQVNHPDPAIHPSPISHQSLVNHPSPATHPSPVNQPGGVNHHTPENRGADS